MGQNLTKFCCCEDDDKKLITVPKQSIVDRNIYTLRELSEEDIPETDDNDNLNETVQTLREIKINKSIIICRKFGQPSDEYIILDELGEGSYGVVLKVAHRITKNIRALKIINKLNIDKNLSKTKLYDEIKILKDIDHPNIIKIYEFFEDDENYYMVTEYCPEGDLSTHVEKLQYFNETIVRILMFQILSAVLYLHSRKIIHGDLKLENILIETLSMKTAKSFRSSITYDLDKMKGINSNANSNRKGENKIKSNDNNNLSKFSVGNNNITVEKDFYALSKNENSKNSKKEFSFTEKTYKEELDKLNKENGLSKNEKIILNDFSNTNTIENDLLHENSKFNQLQNFDLHSINEENENKNLKFNEKEALVNEKGEKNYSESLAKKPEILINPSLNLDDLKNTTDSLFVLNKKSSSDILNQRKLLFMKFNKEHKSAKTMNTLNDAFQSQLKSYKNNFGNKNQNIIDNYSITEEAESYGKSRIITERNSNYFRKPMNWYEFINNPDKKYNLPLNNENKRGHNSSRIIFTDEDVNYDENLHSENFFSKKINKDNANGAQASRCAYNNKYTDLTNKSKLIPGNNNFKKVVIPNLNLKSIKTVNENENVVDNYTKENKNVITNNNLFSKRPIIQSYEVDPLRKTDTIEELEKQLRGNFNNNINNNKKSERKSNLNLNSKRTINNSNINSNLDYSASNQFETINSDSHTMSISMDQNMSTINQNQRDINNLLKLKENGSLNTSKNNDNINNSYTNMNLTLDNFNQLENFSNFEIKLIDFGCSKIFKKGNKKFKDVIGTLFYIAPEVIKNNYNEKCDLWSCGVIMYFLLVGFPPFFALSDTEVFEQILSGDYSFEFSEFENVSDSAKDLIKKLLEINPKKRLSAKEALDHEFFDEISSNRLNEYNLDFSVLQNLKKNKIEQKFQQAVLSYLVYNFAKNDEIINLRKVFKTIDIDQDGRISKEELLLAMQKFDNLNITEKEIQEMLDAIDSDKSGFLEYEEFITATINKKALLTDDNLKAAFYLFDQDKNGTISTEEIKNILIGKARNIPEKVVIDLFKQINNGDSTRKANNGEINFEEFKKIIYQVVNDE